MANVSQLNDLRSYSRHWLGEFIDLYQVEECLWQPKHPDYSNNNVRNRAYDKLVEKLKEVEPNPDRNMVVRKINSLRSAFRREYRKTNAKQNYETRLWYYDKLSFIADQNVKRSLAGLASSASASDHKPAKRSLTLAFEDDDSIEFEDEHQMEASSAHSASQTDLQTDAAIATVANGEIVPVSIVKSEDHKQQHPHHQEPPPLHHHHQHHQQQQHQQQQQQHHHHHHSAAEQIHAQTQPQHTTAVKVLEITSLDSNSQREIQQAVNSLEQQQHQLQLQQQHQHANSAAAAAQLTQIHQQVPTIQIAREHLQPLFGTSATAYTTTATSGGQRAEDEFDAIGINVASKLRVMNTHQRIVAEKLISDVLFNGQLDNLSVNSHLSQ